MPTESLHRLLSQNRTQNSGSTAMSNRYATNGTTAQNGVKARHSARVRHRDPELRDRLLGRGDLGGRDLRDVGRRHELGIAGHAHLGDVEAGDLDLGAHAVRAEPLADRPEHRTADDDVPYD